MKKTLLSLFLLSITCFAFSQTTHQVCVTAMSATGGTTCSHSSFFTPANLNIAVGDNIEFTTFFIGTMGYGGTTHQIRFNGSSPQDVVLTVSTNILSPLTTVTTPAFNTPGVFSMECVNGNHCFIGQQLDGWSCTGHSVTVGSPTEIAEYERTQTINVYPNPTTDVVNVNLLPLIDDNPSVYLIDLLGKVVATSTNIAKANVQFDVSDLTKGSYVVKIVSNKETLSYPLIIQ